MTRGQSVGCSTGRGDTTMAGRVGFAGRGRGVFRAMVLVAAGVARF
jgi:hypothetical protein